VADVADEPTDAALLRRAARGDRDAFGEVVRRHQDRLWAVALRTLGDPDDAADALQDALLAAWRRAGSYRGDAAVTTWLHRIVVNACLDRVRRERARAVVPLAEGHDPAAARDEAAARDTTLDVQAALATLPVEQRAALVLVDVLGHSVEDAATVLGVPTGTVKSRCARGRARLAVLLRVVDERNGPGPTDVGPRERRRG
jgi:RNA polymerase sigma-70 factor (ECF subfamily)